MLARFASLLPLTALGVSLSACDEGTSACPTCKPKAIHLDEPIADWSGTPVESFGQLQLADGFLRSEAGDVVQLKGVSSMWLNWEPDGYAESLEALEWMRDTWRVSVIRAAMGVAPDGAYLSNPEKALGQVRRIVENAVAAGVYVIIDWHDHDAHLDDHRDAAVEFFGMMAEEFGDLPNVLYEPYNEPLQVDWSETLVPYHKAVIDSIREHDPDNIVILGTPNWCQDVDVAAMDPIDGPGIMYALHFYACTHTNRGKAEVALRRRVPLFVTEWGATHADGGLDGIVCESLAQDWHDWMNVNAVSWTAWKLDGCPDSSCLLQIGAPVDGPWDDWLQGHGPFVREQLLQRP
ncbi:MAG: glycoside hydrolase family 5 protein [Myxococcales bacterium]|nr:glycoside hydrolase family 5 protein [Myxococcales bacterium]